MIKFVNTPNGEISYSLTRKRVKNINFRIKSDGIVYISANRGVSESYIKELIIKNSEAFSRQINLLKERADRKPPENTFYLLGRKYDVEIISSSENKAVLTDRFTVYTDNIELVDGLTEDFYRQKISEVYPRLMDEVRELIKEENIPAPSAVRIKEMKSRWGSCNVMSRAISLNSRLIKYPEGCIRYVILHELAHLKHKGHDRAFYGFVEKYMKDYKTYVNILKKPYYEADYE